MIKCLLCELSTTTLASHLKARHGMTSKQYREKYPGALTSKINPTQIEKQRATKSKKDSKNKRLLLERLKREEELIAAGNEPIVCHVCGFESMISIISHVIEKHNMKMDVYRASYPKCIVQRMPLSQRKAQSNKMKEKLEDPFEREAFLQWRSFPSEVKHWIRKGFDPREAETKIKEFQRAQSLKGNNDKTRALRSERSSGDNNPMSLVSIADRHGVSIQEASMMTPCHGRVGDRHPMFGKKHTEEAIEKIANAPHLSNPAYRSIPERQLEELCAKIAPVSHNVGIGRWNVDVLFNYKKLIVEFFGDYWHMNPAKYDDPNVVHGIMKITAGKIWEKDASKLTDLKARGYEVIVVWESDWRLEKEKHMKKIQEAYEKMSFSSGVLYA